MTEHGKEQCQNLRDTFPFHRGVSIVLASPLKRTIQTATYVFAPTLEERQLPFVLVPKAQEISHLTCDLGHDHDVVRTEAPKLVAQGAPSYDQANLDMSLVGEDWNSKVSYSPTVMIKSEALC